MTNVLRVLLLHDAGEIGSVICSELRRAGYKVDEHRASAGATGDAIAGEEWDVIIGNTRREGPSLKIVAHDLNNLLTSIIGAADLSLTVSDLPDEVRTDLESIRDAGRQAAEMTRALAPASATSKTASGSGGTSMESHGHETVLVVEDHAGPRSTICRTLERLGYDVLEAENGEDALRVLQKHHAPIQLLVTDLMMPEMGGSELGHMLFGLYPSLRVLFVSGLGAEHASSDPALLRQSSYLAKPFTIQQLAEHVRALLNRSLEPDQG